MTRQLEAKREREGKKQLGLRRALRINLVKKGKIGWTGRIVADRSSAVVKWLFCACVLALAVFQFSENTADPDLWAHVLAGEHILMTGKLQPTEPYSWTARGTPWINHELLAEIALGTAHKWAGGPGILLLKMLTGLAAFGIALRLGGADLSWPNRAVAWGVGAVAVVEISYGFAPRPQIFTALALSMELWLIRRVARGQWAWALALPVLCVFWVNTHGGVLAGIALLAASTVALTFQFFWQRRSSLNDRMPVEPVAPRATVALWAGCVLCPVALLANPYGWELVRWTISGVVWLHHRPELEEWRPTELNWDHAAFFILLALTALAFLLTHRKRALWEVVVCAGLAVFALRSARHTTLFALAALAFVPPHLADALARRKKSFNRLLEMGRAPPRRWALAGLLALLTLGIGVATFTLHKENPLTIEVPRNEYPVSAIDFIRAHGLRGNLLVFFDWGEMCLWELPDCAVSLDGRWETCYPRDLIPEHWKFYNAEPVDKKILDIDRADLALLPVNLAGAEMLAKKMGWKAVYFDDLAVVLLRQPGRYPKLAGPPVRGLPDASRGRAPFPDKPSARLAE